MKSFRSPTGIVATTRFVRGSIRETALAWESKTKIEPRAATTPLGERPTLIVRVTLSRVGSMRRTVL